MSPTKPVHGYLDLAFEMKSPALVIVQLDFAGVQVGPVHLNTSQATKLGEYVEQMVQLICEVQRENGDRGEN